MNLGDTESIKGHMNDPLMKAMKAVNFISGKSMTKAELTKHRKLVEWAGQIAAPKGDIKVRSFNVGEIQCEVVKPDYAYNPNFAIMYAHGGGYMAGGLNYARVLAAKLAIATGFTVYTFDYRLAPEHPYPIALDDGRAVWDYLTKEKYFPEKILLAGDSAGGNLALCLSQRLLAEGKALPRALLLFSPWTDMTGTGKSYETNKEIDPILSRAYVMSGAMAYAFGIWGRKETDIKDEEDKILAKPQFSPINGQLSGLPPVYIMAGRNGILLDDSIMLNEKILEAGGIVSLDIEDKGWHVYQQMPIPIATRAMKRLSRYVSKLIYSSDK